MLQNPMVAGLAQVQTKQDRRTDALREAHEHLFHEMARALELGYYNFLANTPGFGSQRLTVADVIYDGLSGPKGDESLAGLLRIVAGAATGFDGNLQAEALAWISARAGEHADFHASDLADKWSEAE